MDQAPIEVLEARSLHRGWLRRAPLGARPMDFGRARHLGGCRQHPQFDLDSASDPTSHAERRRWPSCSDLPERKQCRAAAGADDCGGCRFGSLCAGAP